MTLCLKIQYGLISSSQRLRLLQDDVDQLRLRFSAANPHPVDNLRQRPQDSTHTTAKKENNSKDVSGSTCQDMEDCFLHEEGRPFASQPALTTISVKDWKSSRKQRAIPAETCLIAGVSGDTDGEGDTDESGIGKSTTVELLAIGSCALLHEITRITGHEFSHMQNVFPRPFTLLQRHYDIFIARPAELEAECKALETSRTDEEVEKSAADLNPHTAKIERIRRLQDELTCLNKVLKEHVKPYPEAGVFFTDLWRYFAPGDLVISRKSPSQAQRVLRSSYGHKDSKQETYISTTSRNFMPFVLHCYQIDCDGESLGPIPTALTVSYFEGQRELASLDVYSISFDSDHVSQLVNCGKSFMSIIQSPGKQVWYDPNHHQSAEIHDVGDQTPRHVVCPNVSLYSRRRVP